jgi:hypothetical protein
MGLAGVGFAWGQSFLVWAEETNEAVIIVEFYHGGGEKQLYCVGLYFY